jgi:hypothetical protein
MQSGCAPRCPATACDALLACGPALPHARAGHVWYIDADARFDFIQFLDLLVNRLRLLLPDDLQGAPIQSSSARHGLRGCLHTSLEPFEASGGSCFAALNTCKTQDTGEQHCTASPLRCVAGVAATDSALVADALARFHLVRIAQMTLRKVCALQRCSGLSDRSPPRTRLKQRIEQFLLVRCTR